LSLTGIDVRGDGEVNFSDERDRAGVDLPASAFASITFEGADQSWGEFLSRRDVALLHAWTGALLHDWFTAALPTEDSQ
jgi:hypothetical protein